MTIGIGHQFINGGRLTILSNEKIRIETSRVDCDADGANGQNVNPPAYAPSDYGKPTLDKLANAGHPGNWWALVTDDGKKTGTPIIQGPHDPAPGAYVSTTTLRLPIDGQFDRKNPRCYVDASAVPFVVVCPEIIKAVGPVVMGCAAMIENPATGEKFGAVVADGGNTNEMGEISLAALRRAKISGNPSGVDEKAGINIEIYPGMVAIIDGVKYPLQHS